MDEEEAAAADPMSKDMKGMEEGRGGWNGAVGTWRWWSIDGGLRPVGPAAAVDVAGEGPVDGKETGGMVNSLGIVEGSGRRGREKGAVKQSWDGGFHRC